MRTCRLGLIMILLQRFGDGRWVAQWPTSVFDTGTGARLSKEEMNAMAPVPVTRLNCDGDTYRCTANLVCLNPKHPCF